MIEEVLIESTGRTLRAAAVAGGELVELVEEPRQSQGAPGSLYVGRVVRHVPSLRGAFVELGLERPALLDVDKNPPSEGSALAVQIIEAASGDKGARVSRRLTLEGHYVVFIPGGKGVSVSRRVGGEAIRRRLQETAGSVKQAGEGLIVRAAAVDAPAGAVAKEIAALRGRWESVAGTLKTAEPPACVVDDGDGLARLLRRFAAAPRFVFDDRATARLAERAAARLGLSPAIETEADGRLFDRHGIADILASAQMAKLPLPSGGRLFIETTAAVTAIDVDSGGAINGADAALRTNLEATAEIARQIRLRDLGGVIVVDFLKTPARTTRGRVESAMRRAVEADRISIQVLGWTRAGLFEMIRTRTRAVMSGETL
jgi:ribonuclease G